MKAHVLGLALLRKRGVQLLSAVDGQNPTEETDEITEGMVTILAVFAQIEKKRLVKKLKVARDRKSFQKGKRVEGRIPSGYFHTTKRVRLCHPKGHPFFSCPGQRLLES
jgi:DNA invertase Pin-like site-specific DNA recombinase